MVVGASLGEMLIPLTVANISFDWYQPISFLYILLACAVAGLLIYGAIVIVGQPLARAKQNTVDLSAAVICEEDAMTESQQAYGTFER